MKEIEWRKCDTPDCTTIIPVPKEWLTEGASFYCNPCGKATKEELKRWIRPE